MMRMLIGKDCGDTLTIEFHLQFDDADTLDEITARDWTDISTACREMGEYSLTQAKLVQRKHQ
jgi:hypothetical protein